MAYSELHKNTNVVEAIQKAGGIVCPYGPCMTFVWYTFNKAGLSGFLCDGAITGYPHHNMIGIIVEGKLPGYQRLEILLFLDGMVGQMKLERQVVMQE